MAYHRGYLHHAETMHFMVVLWCTLFCLATCGPCSKSGMQNTVEYDACGFYRDNFNSPFQDAFGDDVSLGIASGNSAQLRPVNVCTNSNLFCFPSTLPGVLSQEHNNESTVLEVSGVQSDTTLPLGSTQAINNLSWSSNSGIFKLLSGKFVSCSLTFQEGNHDTSCCQSNSGNQTNVSSCRGPVPCVKPASFNSNENYGKIKSGILDGSSSLDVEISPHLLDWGQKYLYFPSLAFLTVVNIHSARIVNVYEPYSTNSQFYPCNFSEMMLGPGEVASICFVFLPTRLGLSSSQLILQTSSGGFLIQARGFAIESPYGIKPLVGLDVTSSGRWSKNLSLFNPSDETLYVEDVTAWISFSSGNTCHSTKSTCSAFMDSADHSMSIVEKWLDVRSGHLPVMAMRPSRNWEVGPYSTETIMQLDFPYHTRGKIFGAFCMQLLRSSKDKVDTVMVPLEAEVGGKSTYDKLTSPVSVSLEALVPCGASGTVVVALSLRNAAPYLLSVVKISEIGEIMMRFQIKYMEGLMLFPGTVTQVAVLTSIQLNTSAPEIPNINMNCKLHILTNDSSGHQIEIPCNDIFSVCSRHQLDSFVRYEHHPDKIEHDSARSASLDSTMQSPSQFKALDMAEADELVLENWRSQGTAIGVSVLEDHEVLFPMVPVGTHHSKWITVRNPSHQPAVMQLILNSGLIIDECRDQDGLLQPSSSGKFIHNIYTTTPRYGFSIEEGALTEAYVHPYGRASLGPIFFHPSSRCGWKSSALIRNNLSGVEWLSLQGFGGALSLVLFEGSDPLQIIEFKFSLPSPLNFSPPDILYKVADNTPACSQPFSKELYAKNLGDLPLEVSRIKVSGAECGLDGFVVHNCKGFALEPGESMKLLISYQTDYSIAKVRRDLELALATGILVIPMKASLPISLLNFCKNSILWMRVKKSSVAILLAASIMFLIFCFILPQAEKFSRVSTDMNGFLKSIGDEETWMVEAVGRYSDGQGVAPEQGKTTQLVKSTLGYQNRTNCLLDTQKEIAVPFSLLSKTVAVETSDIQETSQPGNLTVKTGKEKGRRRRKKKGSGPGLTGQFEVSSNQSGNSTPSSPLSPVTSFTPKRSWPLSPDMDQCVEARNPFAHVADQRREKSSSTGPASKSKANVMEPKVSVKYCTDSLFFPTQEKPSVPRKTVSKPVLLPSTTFPTSAPDLMCPPLLALTSNIAPHARAPGSKLYDQTPVKTEEKMGHEDEFKYDIWGVHLFGLHRTGRSKEVSAMSPLATDSNYSFFARGPQTLKTYSHPRSVSSHQEG